jgi:hypothetical protein
MQAMYADGHLAADDDECIRRLLTAMGYSEHYDRIREYDASVSRVSWTSRRQIVEMPLMDLDAFSIFDFFDSFPEILRNVRVFQTPHDSMNYRTAAGIKHFKNSAPDVSSFVLGQCLQFV